MNDTVNWVDHAIHAANAFLSEPNALRAVLFGLLISWSGSQALKFLPSMVRLNGEAHRQAVQFLAFTLAYVPVALLWPGPWSIRLLAAVTTGLCAPTAYSLVVRILYHYFPWLEPRLSAKPQERNS